MFRTPAVIDEDGLFMTLAQFKFFLNRYNGEKMVDNKSPEFVKYYNQCRIYNLIYDLTDIDESLAQFYWDTENESVGVMFSKNGKVADALKDVPLVDLQDGEDFAIDI